MHNNSLYCRVCGLEQGEAPWGTDGNTASFEICPCCGVEFGIEDCTQEGTNLYRKKWLSNGANWLISDMKPINLDLKKQLRNIGVELL